MRSLAESQANVSLLTQRLQSRSNTRWRLGTRALSAFTILLGIALNIGVIAQPKRSRTIPSGDSTYTYAQQVYSSPNGLSILGLALIWNVAEFITFRVRGRGIHPGAHVAIDLNLWMGFLGSGVVELIYGYWNAVAVTAGTVKLICGVIHFILFVFACIDTDRRRKLDKARSVVQITSVAANATATNNTPNHNNAQSHGALQGLPPIPPGMALVPIEMLRLAREEGAGRKIFVSEGRAREDGALGGEVEEGGYRMNYLAPVKG